ncbi:hypothetical protein H4219_005110 [Mycoemilia scoparia]|uniref:Uncharacterized protein n=1 Tax=Mycoemilia scoparia TaxID=417184 RepID=A0A9W7ZV52_9FUNG|nr:hypothetical protein H4219_005110 [Mycoemilia scoparia]
MSCENLRAKMPRNDFEKLKPALGITFCNGGDNANGNQPSSEISVEFRCENCGKSDKYHFTPNFSDLLSESSYQCAGANSLVVGDLKSVVSSGNGIQELPIDENSDGEVYLEFKDNAVQALFKTLWLNAREVGLRGTHDLVSNHSF